MTSDLLQLITMCFVMGAISLWYSFKKLRIRRLVEDTPTSKTRSAAQGFSEFQGYAWTTGPTAKCSLSNDCVYYKISLQKHVKRGKNSTWETVFTRGLMTNFLILDSTGAVQVDVEGATLQIEKRITSWRDLSEFSKSHLLKETLTGLAVFGFPPVTGLLGLFGPYFRIVEESILLGSPLLVLGEFQSHSSLAKSAPITPGLLAFYDKVQTDPRLKIGTAAAYFDLNRDGKVEADELRRGLFYLARTLINNPSSSLSATDLKEIPLHGVVKKSETNELVVMDCHQSLYTETGNWRSYALFIAGAALILFGIFLVLNSGSFSR